ncbi:MAG: glycosyltransferase [Thermodesulfobacteriota bacterium]|nr:glycosyltransferase [Thermodesulfobacteriota bacterium]
MKTLCILTASFPPSSNVGALRPFRLAKRISHEGWKVIIISKMPDINFAHNTGLLTELASGVEIHYISKKKIILYPEISEDVDKFFHQFQKESVSSKNKIIINRLKGTAKEQLLKFVVPDLDIFIVPLMIKKLLPLLKSNGEKVILSTSPTHSLHLAGLICKKISGIPWVADFRDPWDRYPITGSIYLKNPVERQFKKMVIRSADALISTTDTYHKNLIDEHSNLDSNKFYKITNSYDETRINPTAKKAKDKFVISYTGIFYPNKDPFTFFRALKTWFDGMESQDMKKYQEILTVQLIGSKSKAVEQVIKTLDLRSVVKFIDRVPHEEALRLSLSSDMLLICAGLGEQSRPGWIPSKLLEYLGCRIPILAICREGEMAGIIRRTQSGYVITEENHDMVCNILQKEIDNKLAGKTDLNFKFKNIEQFEEKNTMGQFVQIIEQIAR